MTGPDSRMPVRPRTLYWMRPAIPRLELCRAAERRERQAVEDAVRQALAAVGYDLVPSQSTGKTSRRRWPRIQLGRRAFYARPAGNYAREVDPA